MRSRSSGNSGAGDTASAGAGAGVGAGRSTGLGPRVDPRNQNNDKKDDEESSDEDADSDDSDAEDAESDDADAEADVAEAAPKPRPKFGSNRPANVSRATGGGGTRPGDADKDEEEVADADADDSPVAVVDTEQDEEHRFTFYQRANQAFATGNETEAFQYLYAHIITEDNALAEHPVSWYTGINEPRVGLRWGVAVDYRPRKFDGDPPVFGDAVADSDSQAGGGGGGNFNPGRGASGGNRGNRGGNRPPAANAAPQAEDPNEQLAYYTGEFGEKFLQRIETRRAHSQHFWGASLHDIDATKVFEISDGTDGNRGNRGSRGNRGGGDSGGGRFSTDGDQAPAQPSSSAPRDRRNRNNNDDDEPKLPGFVPEFEADPTSLVPGAIMLGVGRQADMLQKAKAHGIDLLAVFDVQVTVSSRDVPKNSTMLTVYNVKTGEKVAYTRRLNHMAYAKSLDDGRDDQIETELDGVFQEATDINFKATALPEIPADKAGQRVDFMLKQDISNPLPVLAEFKVFLEEDLISEDDFVAAAAELIGPGNAAQLVAADIEQREEALREWLPGQYTIDDTDTTEFR